MSRFHGENKAGFELFGQPQIGQAELLTPFHTPVITHMVLSDVFHVMDREGSMPRCVAMRIDRLDTRHHLVSPVEKLDDILQRINSRTKVIFIANPNNPTGTLISRDELDDFMDKVPLSVVVVLDEAYHEFLHPEDDPEIDDDFDVFIATQNVTVAADETTTANF